MRIDWSKVRRTDHGMTEEEKEGLLDRLNEYIQNHRSVETIVAADEEGWDYRPEEDIE